jgi:hypothetical protein
MVVEIYVARRDKQRQRFGPTLSLLVAAADTSFCAALEVFAYFLELFALKVWTVPALW